MSKTKPLAIAGVIFCSIMASVAQLLLKLGANNLEFDILAIVTNIPLIAGLLVYAFAAIILIISLKYGELSVVYPFIALSFIWVAFLSMNFLGETLSALNWLGILAIVAGVSFIGVGGK